MNSEQSSKNEILQFIDPHLVIRVIDSDLSQSKDTALTQELLNMKRQVLFKTLLFNEQIKFTSENKSLADAKDCEAIESTKQHVTKLEEETKDNIKGFLNLMENFRKTNNFDTSSSMHKKIIDETSLNKVLEYANILYETGRYSDSKLILSELIKISSDNKKSISKAILALWKIFAINIQLNDWKEAFVTFNQLQSVIETLKNNLVEDYKKISIDSTEKLQVDFKHILLHRGYLIHWSLFLVKDSRSNLTTGLEAFLDLVFTNDYFNVIETSFGNLFRYLIVLSIISKSKSKLNTLKLTFESLPYEDEFIRLFNSMFTNFDFENSFALVKDCVKFIKQDYFLKEYQDLFVSKCKEILLENYIYLNSSINLNTFALYLEDNVENTRAYIIQFFKLHYPEADLTTQEEIISFNIPSDDNYHVLKARELFEVTKNMVGLVNLSRQSKI